MEDYLTDVDKIHSLLNAVTLCRKELWAVEKLVFCPFETQNDEPKRCPSDCPFTNRDEYLYGYHCPFIIAERVLEKCHSTLERVSARVTNIPVGMMKTYPRRR